MKRRSWQVWLSVAAGLSLMLGRMAAADTNAANYYRMGELTQRKHVFTDFPLSNNAPVSVTNPTRLGTLVEPRLVTNPAIPYWRGGLRTAPVTAQNAPAELRMTTNVVRPSLKEATSTATAGAPSAASQPLLKTNAVAQTPARSAASDPPALTKAASAEAPRTTNAIAPALQGIADPAVPISRPRLSQPWLATNSLTQIWNANSGGTTSPRTASYLPRSATNVTTTASAGATPASSKPASSVKDRSMESLENAYGLHVADKVRFRVIEDQEEAKVLTITDAGQLDVPELGLVPAVGKTCKQLAYEVKSKLEQSKYFHATVVLSLETSGPTARRVYVEGEVQRPGVQEFPGGGSWTVARAIMRAGGFKQWADKKNVTVTRAGQTGKLTVNVEEVLAKGRTDKDLALEAEDMIFVPQAKIRVFN